MTLDPSDYSLIYDICDSLSDRYLACLAKGKTKIILFSLQLLSERYGMA